MRWTLVPADQLRPGDTIKRYTKSPKYLLTLSEPATEGRWHLRSDLWHVNVNPDSLWLKGVNDEQADDGR